MDTTQDGSLVQVYRVKNEIVQEEGHKKSVLKKVPEFQGVFLGFGSDVVETYDGVEGTFSTAIVRDENGFLHNVPVELVQFLQYVSRPHQYDKM